MTPHEVLAEYFPPLEQYCPIAETLSAEQLIFLLSTNREALYGGAVGGGKSAALLAAALRYVHMPGYSALLLRRTYPELEKSGGLIPLADSWLAGTDAQRAEGGRKWKFPSGARVEFGHVEHEHSKTAFQGAAFSMVGFDELTHFTDSMYDYIGFSRQRRSHGVKAPIQTLSTANPGGVGHLWVKNRFITKRKDGVLFVPAKVKDNPAWRPGEYEESLAYLPDELRKQLLEGDWDAFEEQAFLDFDEDVHCVRAFEVDKGWRRFESMDYGISHPTAWLAWATDYDGNHLIYDYFYKPALPSESAPAILKKRLNWRSDLCFGDPLSLAQRTGGTDRWGDPMTIESEFASHGVPIVKANNNPRAGYTRLRELVKPDPGRRFPDWHHKRGETGSPRLFFVKANVPELVDQVKAAPTQPLDKRFAGEQIDSDWEGKHGHGVAATRYGAMSHPDASERVVQPPDDPRRLLLWRHHRKREAANSSVSGRPAINYET